MLLFFKKEALASPYAAFAIPRQNVMQDTTVAVVFHFIQRIDAADQVLFVHGAVGAVDAHIEVHAGMEGFQAHDVDQFVAHQVQGVTSDA